ncbi:hypothetical protein J9317_02415 [Metabacillus sp. KIGAM252]|uniref:Uncharacterized protein n=1 Tax=Metabacillus flavus TaxID=2823519 RepID=A0ABS5LA79_9BACI|nr:hypothetical protein [Metabacillus flavus]MBS2967625.1 hypothetical protein [Metabacillus flavus]
MGKKISYGALVFVLPLSILSIVYKTSIYLVLLFLTMAIYFLIASIFMFREGKKPLAIMVGFLAIIKLVLDNMLYNLLPQVSG